MPPAIVLHVMHDIYMQDTLSYSRSAQQMWEAIQSTAVRTDVPKLS